MTPRSSTGRPDGVRAGVPPTNLTRRSESLPVSSSAYLRLNFKSAQPHADLWKVIAPFVSLEEELFSHDVRALEESAEAFVVGELPEASPLGRAA